MTSLSDSPRCGNPQLTPEWEQFIQSVHSEGVRHLTSPLTPRQLAGQKSFAVQTGKASGAPGREWLARRGGQLTWLVWGAYFAFAGWPQPEAGVKDLGSGQVLTVLGGLLRSSRVPGLAAQAQAEFSCVRSARGLCARSAPAQVASFPRNWISSGKIDAHVCKEAYHRAHAGGVWRWQNLWRW